MELPEDAIGATPEAGHCPSPKLCPASLGDELPRLRQSNMPGVRRGGWSAAGKIGVMSHSSGLGTESRLERLGMAQAVVRAWGGVVFGLVGLSLVAFLLIAVANPCSWGTALP